MGWILSLGRPGTRHPSRPTPVRCPSRGRVHTRLGTTRDPGRKTGRRVVHRAGGGTGPPTTDRQRRGPRRTTLRTGTSSRPRATRTSTDTGTTHRLPHSRGRRPGPVTPSLLPFGVRRGEGRRARDPGLSPPLGGTRVRWTLGSKCQVGGLNFRLRSPAQDGGSRREIRVEPVGENERVRVESRGR